MRALRWAGAFPTMAKPDDSEPELDAASVLRRELARWCAEADAASSVGDGAWLAASLQAAVPLVAEHLVDRVRRAVAVAEADADQGRDLWVRLRPEMRVRRPIT